jgi:hypothetical protein
MATDPLPASPALNGRLRWFNRVSESFARDEYWRPTAVPYSAAQTYDRTDAPSSTNLAVVTTQTLSLHGGAILKPDTPINFVSFFAGNTGLAAAAATNQWFAIVDINGNVLRKTADDLGAVWTAQTEKKLTLSSQLTVADVTAVYLALVVVSATPPNLRGIAITTANPPLNLAPVLSGNGAAALTVPADLGAVTALPTAGSYAGQAYAYVS